MKKGTRNHNDIRISVCLNTYAPHTTKILNGKGIHQHAILYMAFLPQVTAATSEDFFICVHDILFVSMTIWKAEF